MSGVMIPFGLKLCGVDPALASSIFLTTVTDVAGFFFFLGWRPWRCAGRVSDEAQKSAAEPGARRMDATDFRL